MKFNISAACIIVLQKGYIVQLGATIPESASALHDKRLFSVLDHATQNPFSRFCVVNTYDVKCPPGSQRSNNITAGRASCTFHVSTSYGAYRSTIEAWCTRHDDRPFEFVFGWRNQRGLDPCAMLTDPSARSVCSARQPGLSRIDLKKYGGLRDIEVDCDLKSSQPHLQFSWRTGSSRQYMLRCAVFCCCFLLCTMFLSSTDIRLNVLHKILVTKVSIQDNSMGIFNI